MALALCSGFNDRANKLVNQPLRFGLETFIVVYHGFHMIGANEAVSPHLVACRRFAGAGREQ